MVGSDGFEPPAYRLSRGSSSSELRSPILILCTGRTRRNSQRGVIRLTPRLLRHLPVRQIFCTVVPDRAELSCFRVLSLSRCPHRSTISKILTPFYTPILEKSRSISCFGQTIFISRARVPYYKDRPQSFLIIKLDFSKKGSILASKVEKKKGGNGRKAIDFI